MERRDFLKAVPAPLLSALALPLAVSPAVAAQASASQRLAALGEELVAADFDLVPLREASAEGAGPRAGRAMQDLAPGWQERARRLYPGIVERAQAIAPAELPENDRIIRELLIQRARDRHNEHQYPLTEIGFLNPTGGLLPTLVYAASATQPLRNEADFGAWLARVEASAACFDQAIVAMKAAAREGWTAPRPLVEKGMRQLEAVARVPGDEMPFWGVMARYPRALAPERRAAFEARYRAVLDGRLRPALQRFATFAREEYQPLSRESAGLAALPRGDAAYRTQVRRYTTLDLEPDTIHTLGLAEVARVRARLLAVARSLGFKGEMREFSAWLESSPANYPFKSADEVLEYLRAVHRRVVPLLPRLFKRVPRAPLEIQLVDPSIAAASSASYQRPLPDGSRPGVFRIPVVDPQRIAAFGLTALLLHEGMPGHHLDIGLSTEMDMARFRRAQSLSAYSEGWGLYAESLGEELGLYTDPWALLGRFTAELHRAARLVVDTGMHARGWSRDQAIRYLVEERGQGEGGAIVAVERYMASPGQALAYKVGELEILKLRAEAREALGARFDLREFHEAVLGAGPLTLPLLRVRVQAWVAREKSRA